MKSAWGFALILIFSTPVLQAQAPQCQFIFHNQQDTNPLLLVKYETKLKNLSSSTTETIARRGLTMPDYQGKDLIQYLFGDWSKALGSHDFTRILKQKIKAGASASEAAENAAQEVFAEIESQIQSLGITEYSKLQSRNTYLGIPIAQKRANGMSSYTTKSALSEQALLPSAFSYARTAYTGIAGKTLINANHPMIVLDVKVDAPIEHAIGTEYIIPSHLPPHRIERFYLGFSNWFNVREQTLPPEIQEQWYSFEILKRDEQGVPLIITCRPIKRTNDNYFETWSMDSTIWDSRRLKDPNTIRFEKENPLLKSTLDEIKKQLKMAPLE